MSSDNGTLTHRQSSQHLTNEQLERQTKSHRIRMEAIAAPPQVTTKPSHAAHHNKKIRPHENQTSRKPKSTRKTLRHVGKMINPSLPNARRAASLSATPQPRKAQQKKKTPTSVRTSDADTATQPMYRLLSRGSFRSVDRTQNMPAPAPACKACQQSRYGRVAFPKAGVIYPPRARCRIDHPRCSRSI
jgi:hypothetical protein